jgi:phosphohistidine phosphatase SixA/8-oxo-dGTP pyrophosphatase MutT (NUDIX family)
MASSKNKGHVYAAGTVIVKGRGLNQRIAVIHRPHRQDWSFPKGKIDGSDTAAATAIRETLEETGLKVTLHQPLTTQEYIFDGLPKTVFYWRATLINNSEFIPNDEADQLVWVSLKGALKLLSYDVDKDLAREAFKSVETKPLILLRHATSEKRVEWADRYAKNVPPDSFRPLTPDGIMQAHLIADLLSAYGVNKIVSSDSIRCIATVSPYAASKEIPLEAHQILSELGWAVNNQPGIRLVKKLARSKDSIVLCGHRPALPSLAQAIADELDYEELDASLPPAGLIVIHREIIKGRITIKNIEKIVVD